MPWPWSKSASAPPRSRRRGPEETRPARSWEWEQVLTVLLFLGFAAGAIFICFAGLSPAGPRVVREQESRLRITADFPFSFSSAVRTEQGRAEASQQVPPVFRIDLSHLEDFSAAWRRLARELAAFAAPPPGAPADLPQLNSAEVQSFLSRLEGLPLQYFDPADLATLLQAVPHHRLPEVVEESLEVLHGILQSGVYDPEDTTIPFAPDQLNFFNVEEDTGQVRQVQLAPLEDAVRELRISLSSLNLPREPAVALFRLAREGLRPNLVFDPDRTRQARLRAIESVAPVRIQVLEGEILLEPGERVSEYQEELLNAYRTELLLRQEAGLGLNTRFIHQAFLTLVLVTMVALILRLLHGSIRLHLRALTMAALVLLLNLLLVRLVVQIAEGPLGRTSPVFSALWPWLEPVTLGPLIVAILVGPLPGMLAAGVISALTALMVGNVASVLLLTLLANLAAIGLARGIQVRSKVVRAGAVGGLALALGVFLSGLREPLPLEMQMLQALAALGVGILTGIAVVGFLPILEFLFRYTTEITLLELTDFNHPLLRRMQLNAPGSYHHSLMVANLAENAAHAIGANSLVCRVSALYHDIGKLVKPEYFTENQRDGINPHLDRNPSMSALIIKAHVKEGVTLARQYRLPRVVLNAIREHHGTSLIQYFYYKAIEQQKRDTPPIFPNAPGVELTPVNESTYRYEGPKPQSRETAILSLADALEAAGRSLRKVSPASIQDLVRRILQGRLEDGQLSESPITLGELEAIQQSFIFSLHNMLHSRVEYPSARTEPGPTPGPAEAAKTAPLATPPPAPAKPPPEGAAGSPRPGSQAPFPGPAGVGPSPAPAGSPPPGPAPRESSPPLPPAAAALAGKPG